MISFGEAEEHFGAADGFVLGGGVGQAVDVEGVPETFRDMGPFVGLLLGVSAQCPGCPDGDQCVGWQAPRDLNLLVGWAGIAVLIGQATAVLETFPVHIRDQVEQLQREAGQRIRDALA